MQTRSPLSEHHEFGPQAPFCLLTINIDELRPPFVQTGVQQTPQAIERHVSSIMICSPNDVSSQ
jgi:hypothetical protein